MTIQYLLLLNVLLIRVSARNSDYITKYPQKLFSKQAVLSIVIMFKLSLIGGKNLCTKIRIFLLRKVLVHTSSPIRWT